MSEHPEYASLSEAFQERHISVGNQRFVQELLRRLPVSGYFDRGDCLKVTRSDTRHAVEVHPGYSNGFMSEDEILDSVGDVHRWKSGRSKHGFMWGVSHPDPFGRGGGGGGGQRKQKRPDYGVCPIHGMELAATRLCSSCVE